MNSERIFANFGSVGYFDVAFDVVLKTTVLFLAAAVAVHVLHRASSAVRHRIWCLAFLGTLILPVLSITGPKWQIAVIPASAPVVAPSFDPPPLPWDRVIDVAAEPDTGKPPSAEVLSIEQAGNASEPGGISSIPRTAWLWIAGVLACSIPIVVGSVHTVFLCGRATRIADPVWEKLVDDTRCKLRLRRNVRLLECGNDIVPITWGLIRPTVLLPATCDQWSEARRRVVLLHELAHVKRLDLLIQLTARFACAVYWFHPLAWYALRQLRLERELACDDCVVAAGQRASDYASELLEIAEAHHAPRLAIGVAMARGSQLENRLRALFDSSRSHSPLSRKLSRTLLVLAGVFAVSIAAIQPVQPIVQAQEPVGQPSQTVSETERGAEAALRKFGAEIERNADGEVVSLSLGSMFTPIEFGDAEIVYLEKLRWSRAPGAYLDIRQARITNSGVARIARLTQFGALGFYGNRLITDDGLVHLKPLVKLRTLYLDETSVSNAAIKTFKDLESLRRIGLIGTHVTDDGLAELADLQNLEMLNLSYTQVTDIGLEHLKKLVNLERLMLIGTGVTNDGLVHLKGLRKLQRLSLRECSNVSDDGLLHLKGLDNLANLNLARTQITDAGLVHLSGFVNLWGLTLNETAISDAGLVHIKELRNLVRLSISGTRITNGGLTHLSGLPSLEVLGLNDTSIGDQGLEHLAKLNKLKFLNLQGTQVGDGGLEFVKTLSSLQTVDLRETNVTDDGIKSLLKALPNCDVGDWFVWRRQETGTEHNSIPTYLSPGPDLSQRNKTKDGARE